ncbi:DNA glycosylase AlkZ-like family protein [Tsukamurella paurometabola]
MATVDPEIRMIRALRLRAQGLVPGVRQWRTAPDVARGMLAMQAQDAAAVRFGLSLRASRMRPDDAAVLADLAERRIVRNRPARGTLQVAAPEDLPLAQRVAHRALPCGGEEAAPRPRDLRDHDGERPSG